MAGGELLGKDEGKKTKNIDYETRKPNVNLHKRAKRTNNQQEDRIDTKCAAYSNTSTAIVLSYFAPSPTFNTKFPSFNTSLKQKSHEKGGLRVSSLMSSRKIQWFEFSIISKVPFTDGLPVCPGGFPRLSPVWRRGPPSAAHSSSKLLLA